MNNYYVYILQCDDGSYYTGVTNDIERRLEEHTLGIKENAYTSWNDDLKVVYMEEFHDINDAIAREKQIKGWTRRKKQLLIDGDMEGLKKYSSPN